MRNEWLVERNYGRRWRPRGCFCARINPKFWPSEKDGNWNGSFCRGGTEARGEAIVRNKTQSSVKEKCAFDPTWLRVGSEKLCIRPCCRIEAHYKPVLKSEIRNQIVTGTNRSIPDATAVLHTALTMRVRPTGGACRVRHIGMTRCCQRAPTSAQSSPQLKCLTLT